MTLKKYYFLFLVLCLFNIGQVSAQDNRIDQLKIHLDSLATVAPGLAERADINVSNVALSDFLQAVANAHKVNLNINSELNQLFIKNNFSNATVTDILLFVCKEYSLTIDFTGNILSIRKLVVPTIVKPHRVIPISFNTQKDALSIDLKNDTLYVAFKQLMDKTGKNIAFAPGMGRLLLTSYIKDMPFDAALKSIAFANNLLVRNTQDNFYLFERKEGYRLANQKDKKQGSNFFFEVTYPKTKILNVDFINAPISNIISSIGYELKLSMFTFSPLNEAGTVTVKADSIALDLLFDKILENTDYAYKKQGVNYYFGKKEQVSLRDAVVIPLMHRSIEVMKSSGGSERRAGRINVNGTSSPFGNNSFNRNNTSFNTNRQSLNTRRSSTFSERDNDLESLINMIPDDVIKDLKVSVDIELNSFIVSGPSQSIERFKKFIAYIDKPVPVILIEVMVIEVIKTTTVETGISWGIGTEPTVTQGSVFPATDISLGANTVNRIIGGFNGFGSWNLGQVVPNFYAKIKALETNGDIKIRSAPKLSALNGHRANLSIGETTYYAVTQRDIIGSLNPQTSTIVNYQPIDAEFAISIKPMVSGDGQITLDIYVIQSSFNGKKIAEDAPPGINSREFNSIIRVKDKDMVILGGLEEKIKNDTGSGVPFLARIPIIKWFFSKRKREDTRKKLTVLIKPTIIR